MECGPSEKATAPASRSRPISAISSPGEPLGDRRARQDADAGVARAAFEEVHHGGIVHRRRRVGPRDQRRDPARRGGSAGAGDGLAMLGARLADEGAHVDETRRDDVAAAIDDQRAVGRGFRRDGGAEADDAAVADERAPGRLPAARGIDEARFDEGDGSGHRQAL